MGFNDLKKRLNGSQESGGGSSVAITSPLTAFGAVHVEELTPVAQGDFVYSIHPRIFATSSFGAGTSCTSVDGMCELDSGTSDSGSATVRTRRGLKYRPGQGSLMRATALFDEPSAGNAQFIGCGTSECGYFVGYFGGFFGILHNQKASREIRALQITVAAAISENIIITLNSNTPVNATITGNSDIYQTAYEISKIDFTQVGNGGWITDVIGDTIYFISARTGAPSSFNGTYSITSAGSATGSFSQYQEAEAATQDFITSGSFNIDRLDGTGPSGMILNPQKGNVYQIGFQYLGFGNARFGIEDPDTGRFFDYHMIVNSNNRTFPVLKNPNVAVLATSANIGGTDSKILKTASMAAYVQGKITNLDPVYSKTFAFQSGGTNVSAIAIMKVNKIFKNVSCFGEVDLLKITLSNISSGGGDLNLKIYEGQISGDHNVNFENFDEDSIVSFATGDQTSGGYQNLFLQPLNLVGKSSYELVVSGGDTIIEEFVDGRFVIGSNRPIIFVITGNSSGTLSLTWYEQQ